MIVLQGLSVKLSLINGCNRALSIMFTIKTRKPLAGTFICPATCAPLQKIAAGVAQVDMGLLLQTDALSISLALVTTRR